MELNSNDFDSSKITVVHSSIQFIFQVVSTLLREIVHQFAVNVLMNDHPQMNPVQNISTRTYSSIKIFYYLMQTYDLAQIGVGELMFEVRFINLV